MVAVLAVLGAWEVIPWEASFCRGAGQIPVCLPEALTAQTFHPFGAGSCSHQKTEPSCAELLALSEQAGLEPVKSFIPNGNLSLGLTGLSDLLKLLVRGGFVSWTDTPYVGYHQNKEILFPTGIPIGMCSSNPPGVVCHPRNGRGWSGRALHLGGTLTS